MPNDLISYPHLGLRTFMILLLRWSAGFLLLLVVLGIGVFGFAKFFDQLDPAIIARAAGASTLLIVIVGLITVLFAWLEYRHYAIQLTETSLEIRRGILAVIANGISYRRIRDVITTRSLIERLLGVSTLHINLIGDAEEASPSYRATIILPALERRLADRFHNELVVRIGSVQPIA